jgi:hypothetical protein
MQNLVDLPGFEWGTPKSDQFGLWCPLLDCFVLVYHDIAVLRKIQTLTTAKILTCFVRFNEDIQKKTYMANTIASNWTIEDPTSISFTPALVNNSVHPLTIVVPSVLRDPEEVNRFQTWLIFVLKWILWIDHQQRDRANFTASILGLDHGTQMQLHKKIYQILLLENDPSQAETLINQAIHEQNNRG